MVKLVKISKSFQIGKTKITALNNLSLEFRQKEFVSILGQSGCGKTTLLNIIGGIDKYSSGNLIIDGISTKGFSSAKWDAYRNSAIGFIFQSYNLIQHLTVLDNVVLALALTGDKRRIQKAYDALLAVGLEDQLNKYPNQLSGGQMQRVAIARAIVNDPLILLADEPTGALDSSTGEQIMMLLKEISKNKLVIVVTHNSELAEKYSDRIIKLRDGEMVSDSNIYNANQDTPKLIIKKTAMSYMSALSLSLKNLLKKKARTLITAFASSVGIIGVGLVLATSNGMMEFVKSMEANMLAGLPIVVYPETEIEGQKADRNSKFEEFPEGDIIYSYDPAALDQQNKHINKIDENYIEYVDNMPSNYYNSLDYIHAIGINMFTNNNYNDISKISTLNQMPSDTNFILSQYDLIGDSKMPENAFELAFVIDRYNRMNISLLNQYGINIQDQYNAKDFIGKEFKIYPNDLYFYEENNIFKNKQNVSQLYNDENALSLKVTAVLRRRKDVSWDFLSRGLNYTSDLTKYLLADAAKSKIVLAQKEAGDQINVLTGMPFDQIYKYADISNYLGVNSTPVAVLVYAKDFDNKSKIKEYLNAWNKNKNEVDSIIFTDPAEDMVNSIADTINLISIILIAFAGISLFVSTIMIGIITYISVVERTKEIGILRALGARKKDIARVFNAETLIIGFCAGLLGVILTIIVAIPLNKILVNQININNNSISQIIKLPIISSLMLILGSMGLTLIGGFIPARKASKKNPVNALRASN